MTTTDLDYAALHRGYTFTVTSRRPCFSIPPFNLPVNNLFSRNSFFHLRIQYVVNVMTSKINVESYGERPVIRSLEAAKRIPGRWLYDDDRPRLRCASSRHHVYHVAFIPFALWASQQLAGRLGGSPRFQKFTDGIAGHDVMVARAFLGKLARFGREVEGR